MRKEIRSRISSILGAGLEATVNRTAGKNLDAVRAMRHFEGMGDAELRKSLAIYKGLVEVGG